MVQEILNPFNKHFQVVGLLLVVLNLVGCVQIPPVNGESSGQSTKLLDESTEPGDSSTKTSKEYWAALLVHDLETQLQTSQNVYVHPLTLSVLDEQKEPQDVFDSTLHNALTNSRLLKPLNTVAQLKSTTLEALRQRAKRDDTSADGMSLTGDLLQADSELKGEVQLDKEQVNVEITLTDKHAEFLANASVTFPKSLLTTQTKRTKSVKQPVSKGDLRLEISTLHGAHNVTYYEGEVLHLFIRTNQPAYVYVFVSDINQHVTRLYPESLFALKKVKAGKLFILPDDGLPYELPVQAPFGSTALWVVALTNPLEFPEEMNDAWTRIETLPQLVREVSFATSEGYVEAKIVVETIELAGKQPDNGLNW